jgi:Protein of unknown function (DUF992)
LRGIEIPFGSRRAMWPCGWRTATGPIGDRGARRAGGRPQAMVLIALAAVSVSPAVAQTPPTTSAGTLTCKLAPSIGLIIGSRQRMACRFVPNGAYPPEAYVGVMGTIGLDIGITAGGVMAWGVLAPTAGPMKCVENLPALT